MKALGYQLGRRAIVVGKRQAENAIGLAKRYKILKGQHRRRVKNIDVKAA
jgi:hypothetical protein